MMSKERELLERVLDEEDDGISFELSIEIKELLAQPEHITFKDDADKIAHLENSVELLACLLYTKKREPLSDETVGELLMGGFSTHLMDLVRMIEKAHGITGGG